MPSESIDRCPYCLEFEGVEAALEAETQFCPKCGVDWLGAPSGLFREGGSPLPPLYTGELPSSVSASHIGYTGEVPAQIGSPYTAPVYVDQLVDAESPPDEVLERSRRTLPLMLGLLLGLVGVVFFALQLFKARPNAPRGVRGVAMVRSAPPKVLPTVALEEPPALPSPAVSNSRRAEAVRQVIARLGSSLPEAAVLNLKVRVEGGVAYLTGEVDSANTLGLVAKTSGDVFGIRAVDTRGVVVVFREHVVREGDTLNSLAQRYYGRSTLWRTLWKANPNLKDPAALDLGTVVRIPPAP